MNFFNVFLFFLTLSWKFYILLENHLQNVNQQDIIFVFTRLHGNVIKVSLNRPTPHSLFFYKIHFEWVVWFNSEAKRTNFVTMACSWCNNLSFFDNVLMDGQDYFLKLKLKQSSLWVWVLWPNVTFFLF